MSLRPAGIPFGLTSCVSTTDAVLRALAQVRARSDLAAVMEAITRELGFRHYALIHHDDLGVHETGRVRLLDYPAAIEERIITQGNWRRDPVIRACIFTPAAFCWSDLPDIISIDNPDRQCLEQGARWGLNEGITVPYCLLRERSGSCTFAGTKTPELTRRYLGMVQMIGIFAFQAARRIMVGTAPAIGPRPRLHPRTRDCVILAGRGLSNKAIARALGLTPRTVDGYLTEARTLFDAHGRAELAFSAVFAGEIDLPEVLQGQPE